MKQKTIIISLVITAIVLFSIITGVFFSMNLKQSPLPVYGKVSDFTLTNQWGRDFGLSDLKDKVWVADFIFTTCGHICPIMTKNLASIHRSYLLEDGVEMISISVNPEVDTPAVLKKYAEKYASDQSEWHFLTGSREKIKDVAVGSFKVGSIEEPIFHSPQFILVDTKAQIRGYYDGTTDEGTKSLFRDLARLLKEK